MQSDIDGKYLGLPMDYDRCYAILRRGENRDIEVLDGDYIEDMFDIGIHGTRILVETNSDTYSNTDAELYMVDSDLDNNFTDNSSISEYGMQVNMIDGQAIVDYGDMELEEQATNVEVMAQEIMEQQDFKLRNSSPFDQISPCMELSGEPDY